MSQSTGLILSIFFSIIFYMFVPRFQVTWRVSSRARSSSILCLTPRQDQVISGWSTNSGPALSQTFSLVQAAAVLVAVRGFSFV